MGVFCSFCCSRKEKSLETCDEKLLPEKETASRALSVAKETRVSETRTVPLPQTSYHTSPSQYLREHVMRQQGQGQGEDQGEACEKQEERQERQESEESEERPETISAKNESIAVSNAGFAPINGEYRWFAPLSRWCMFGSEASFYLRGNIPRDAVSSQWLSQQSIAWPKHVSECWVLADTETDHFYYASPQWDEEIPTNSWIGIRGSDPCPVIAKGRHSCGVEPLPTLREEERRDEESEETTDSSLSDLA